MIKITTDAIKFKDIPEKYEDLQNHLMDLNEMCDYSIFSIFEAINKREEIFLTFVDQRTLELVSLVINKTWLVASALAIASAETK